MGLTFTRFPHTHDRQIVVHRDCCYRKITSCSILSLRSRRKGHFILRAAVRTSKKKAPRGPAAEKSLFVRCVTRHFYVVHVDLDPVAVLCVVVVVYRWYSFSPLALSCY